MMHLFVFGLYDWFIMPIRMYANIMLENNKMVQDGCIKSTRGAMIPQGGSRKGGLWENKSFVVMCQPYNSSKICHVSSMTQLHSLDC